MSCAPSRKCRAPTLIAILPLFSYYCPMDQTFASAIFEILGSSVRLGIFRLLVKRGQSGMVAGEIAAALDLPPTNVSFHLKSMTHAGLVTVTPEGRFQRYRADLALMSDLIGYLTDECCADGTGGCNEVRLKAICPQCRSEV